MPTLWFQSINSFFVIVLAPVFAALGGLGSAAAIFEPREIRRLPASSSRVSAS